MVRRQGFRLNYAGVAKILKSDEYAARINALAREIAREVGDDAEVEEYTTDRRAAKVSVPAARQARDGALTRAAAAVGLEVRTR
ncbi:hypothetical protein [Rhodococcus tibetensis]|uniref:Uncharacterized protein n=1 Tax=Rhodococcus tibetensis TaxID=2965064 RepID=A0ABT1QC89_9NOCA|nr:hypothetical protein [Rhodococcus sp. FXJ9.536]MCQ4119883.1 hypothetical protein [Rhodococcus sp. FXJ9.536]